MSSQAPTFEYPNLNIFAGPSNICIFFRSQLRDHFRYPHLPRSSCDWCDWYPARAVKQTKRESARGRGDVFFLTRPQFKVLRVSSFCGWPLGSYPYFFLHSSWSAVSSPMSCKQGALFLYPHRFIEQWRSIIALATPPLLLTWDHWSIIHRGVGRLRQPTFVIARVTPRKTIYMIF